ncbi:magnesium transporter [Pediococcus argentinicus]|uniref:Magnesium transporter MgtE n=1 Tax=Pediococcus argentinicus TaxID=480391 RepID=A0A0R2NG62_9LACO|nr:magnesium transporter [Pediococcus argentinicus]KRO24809.1 transcriptional regulator [Pediococcus argentinicus]NKZ22700.1 magnesium transporter [Pediococcus argentinicus]
MITLQEQVEVVFDDLKQSLFENKRTKFRTDFFELHPFDQGRFFSDLDPDDRRKVYEYLTPVELSDAFDELEDEPIEIAEFLDEMQPRYAARLLSAMFADNEADILGVVHADKLEELLNYMNPVDSSRVRQLLKYKDETAGALMTTEFISVSSGMTVGLAMAQVKREAQQAETISYIYVTKEDQKLDGVISVKDLIVNSDDTLIESFMNSNVISVNVNEDQEEIAEQIRDYNFVALPVVNDNEQIKGIVTVDDIIDVIDEESAEDYSKLAGINTEETTNNPWIAVRNRLPWLIILLFLGMLSAALISHFEGVLSKVSVLAIFISLITGTAGNAGTQSLAVAIRRIATSDEEHALWKLILNEIVTGLLIGALTGTTVFLIVLIWQKNLVLGSVVGLAMAGAIFVANLAGSLIPIGMEKIGVDPAVASGPFISTLSDLTSILIYFNIASLCLKMFGFGG